jgi:hypothetical protein
MTPVPDQLDADLLSALSHMLAVQREYCQKMEASMAWLDAEMGRLKRPALPSLPAGVKRAVVCLWGLELTCDFEFDPGYDQTWEDPGQPAYVSLGACYVGGVDLMEMLTAEQVESIEHLLLMDEVEGK